MSDHVVVAAAFGSDNLLHFWESDRPKAENLKAERNLMEALKRRFSAVEGTADLRSDE